MYYLYNISLKDIVVFQYYFANKYRFSYIYSIISIALNFYDKNI